ncbi:MAG: DinB family protein [Bacteroidetes bacterium]|nr:DinB family protein [Bacteroidota bacterium]
MALKDGLIAELKHEASMTRKILERVPLDKKDWKPHEKSMTVGRLATHIAENTQWITRILTADEFDFAANKFAPHTAVSSEELLHIFDTKLAAAITDLENAADEEFDTIWTVKMGDTVMMQLPKKVAIRSWSLNHIVHHRGQLSVFLRLLDVPVPGMYGPSADER